ncbi:trans-1,2-dihydrobenzene-1,2-diol dehydrogenase-like [Spodoptera litura]|uniref:Trans-1,2-dihydrobenzene-1,2-diol dehydrogenase n=1 Tax=Spodoptera litura TaxID=69820 RepID=A0A9J7IST1_SPOLT|nr:trans-1,2-dihydrobenzene-1,2-diol dehydrogenase-like [Spodoptera litura]
MSFPDVAYIGSLNSEHYELSMLFLQHGKHVLCEKPFCLNAKQTRSVINFARKNNLFVMEAVWTRFSPAYADLEKDIQNGKLGDVLFIEADFGIVSPNDRSTHIKEFGGGAMLDVGVYVLQLPQFVWKEEPKKVTTVGSLYDSGVDLTETIILEYEGGRRAVLNIHTQLEMWNKATIYGTKGHVTLEQPFHFPHKVIDKDGKIKNYELHSSNLPYNFTNSPGLVYQALEVARCIKAGLIESPRMTHQESINLAVLEDTVRKQLGVHFEADDKEYP